ncbi:MAG: hypothetical protein L0Y76_04530 [Ignavibacteria bacterium]|nr:hypothetical protein [Ignavibacteria bacterium]
MTEEERKNRILDIETKELPELENSIKGMLAVEQTRKLGPQEQRGYESLLNLQKELLKELKKLKEEL